MRLTAVAGAPHVAVVGAGVGGLSAAIRLAAAGAHVTVFERHAAPGGKMREVEVDGRRLDAGPSVLTMPWVFEELFAAAGARMADLVTLLPVEPACRHFFPDGSRLDLFNDPERSREAIRAFAGEGAARGFDALRAHGRRIFGIVREPFMESPVPTLAAMLHPSRLRLIGQFLQLDANRTLWKALEAMFPDDRLRTLYGRYATYNGSSPFSCPATLSVIVHVEQEFGISVVKGGMARLAGALAEVARRLGVTVRTGAEVERVVVEHGRAAGVVVAGERFDADAVVVNGDALQLHRRLLAGERGAKKAARRVEAIEPSFSAFVVLAVADVGDAPLAHHNVFFSRDYRREFDQLGDGKRPPDDPTVYLCAQDRAPGAAPPADGRERHLLLTNAPALDAAHPIDWTLEGAECRRRLDETLARHSVTLRRSVERSVTPADFEALFPSSRGSLYGGSSNARTAAFERPTNRVPGTRGLYLVGGSAHPGAGVPMVALSGRIASSLAMAELGIAPPPLPAATSGGTSTR